MTEFARVLIKACELDRAGSGDGHYRVTSFHAREHVPIDAVSVQVAHRRPDGECRRIACDFALTRLGDPAPYLSKEIIKKLSEMHARMDMWAFAGEVVD